MRRPPLSMVIIGEGYGQLGNRLSLWAHLLASGREHGFRVMNLAFSEYAPLFELSFDDPCSVRPVLPRLGRVAPRLLRRVRPGSGGRRRLLPGLDLIEGVPDPLDLSDPAVHGPLRTGIHITRGWRFRDHPAVLAHGDFLREFFRPAPAERRAIDVRERELRSDERYLVGVHLRRGDFRDFRGGGFHFDDDLYLGRMVRTARIWSAHDPRFVLFSNEGVDVHRFREAGLSVEVGPGSIVQDLYLMARCDLLLAPPSTFSSWASFHGRVPLAMIQDPHEELEAEHFRVVETA